MFWVKGSHQLTGNCSLKLAFPKTFVRVPVAGDTPIPPDETGVIVEPRRSNLIQHCFLAVPRNLTVAYHPIATAYHSHLTGDSSLCALMSWFGSWPWATSGAQLGLRSVHSGNSMGYWLIVVVNGGCSGQHLDTSTWTHISTGDFLVIHPTGFDFWIFLNVGMHIYMHI